MRFYLRILGPDGEPVLPAQEITLFEWRGEITAPRACTVSRLEAYDQEGKRCLTKDFDPPLHAGAGDMLKFSVHLI